MVFKVVPISFICFLLLQNKAFGAEVVELPGPMEEGMAVKIIGYVWQWGSLKFQVNLHKAKFWNDDIYFHMEVGYWAYDDTITFNTWKADGEDGKGHWEDDETHKGVPDRYKNGVFSKSGLAMRIIAKDDHFHVYMNGKEFTFNYRMAKEDLKDIKFLSIVGDYTVESITWERQVGEKQYEPY